MGEARLALLKGVVATRSGWLGGGEVVEVTYDPRATGIQQLVAAARERGCARRVYVKDEAALRAARKVVGDRAALLPGALRPDQVKHGMSRTSLRHLPMTPLQAARVNATLKEADHLELLSPRQRELLETIRGHPNAPWPTAIGQDIATAWNAAQEVAETLTGKE